MNASQDKLLKALKENSGEFLNNYEEFQNLNMVYRSAIREVKTKLEILDDEFSVKHSRNPIEFVKSRIKKPVSIIEKLQRRNLEISVDSIKKNITDIAGIRVVCSFVDDIYYIANMLTMQDNVELLIIKDYIKHPKANGYRSLHLIIRVPVYMINEKVYVPVEIQIRTIAMDFWASLEHKMKYKKTMQEAEGIIRALEECATDISKVDQKMLEIRKKIDSMEVSRKGKNGAKNKKSNT